MVTASLLNSKLVQDFKTQGSSALKKHQWESSSTSFVKDEMSRDRLADQMDQYFPQLEQTDNQDDTYGAADLDPRDGFTNRKHKSSLSTTEFKGGPQDGYILKTTADSESEWLTVDVYRYSSDSIDTLTLTQFDGGDDINVQSSRTPRTGEINAFHRIILETNNPNVLGRP